MFGCLLMVFFNRICYWSWNFVGLNDKNLWKGWHGMPNKSGTDWIRNHHTQGILLTVCLDAFDTDLDEAIGIHKLSLTNILAPLQTPGTYNPHTNKFRSHCQQWCLIKVSDGLSYYTTGNTAMKTLHSWNDYRWK